MAAWQHFEGYPQAQFYLDRCGAMEAWKGLYSELGRAIFKQELLR
jgi:hypothetical protein